MLDIGISSGYAIPSSRALKMQEMLDKVSELTAFARGAAVRITRTIPQNESLQPKAIVRRRNDQGLQ